MGAVKAGAVALKDQHGTRMCYQRNKCRRFECRKAASDYHRDYERRRAEAGGKLRVPAGPVRDHLVKLHRPRPDKITDARQGRRHQRRGLSLYAIACSADVDVTIVWRIWERRQRFVTRELADRLLAVGLNDSTFVDVEATRRRVAELAEVGVTQAKITHYVKTHATKRGSKDPYPQTFQWRDVIHRERAELVERFYSVYFHEVLHQPTPEERREVPDPHTVINTEQARVSRSRAKENGNASRV